VICFCRTEAAFLATDGPARGHRTKGPSGSSG
jgi:hypothetical protein